MKTKSIRNSIIHFAAIPGDIGPAGAKIVVKTYTDIISAVEKLNGVDITCMRLDALALDDVDNTVILATRIRDMMCAIIDDLAYFGGALLCVNMAPLVPALSSGDLTIKLSKKGIGVSVLDGVVLDVLLACLINLSLNGHFDVARLRNCPKCGNVFYQHGRKSQKYCGRSCSDMGRSGNMFKGDMPFNQ